MLSKKDVISRSAALTAVSVICLSIIGCGGETVQPQTQGQWSNYRGNQEHTGHVDLQIDPNSFHVKWEKAAPFLRGSVMTDQSNLYYSNDSTINAVSLSSGGLVWTAPDGSFIGPFGQPVLNNHNIYALRSWLSYDIPASLYELNKLDGSINKKSNNLSNTVLSNSGLRQAYVQFDEDLAFIADADLANRNLVHAVSVSSGEIVWETHVEHMPTAAVPLLHNGQLFVSTWGADRAEPGWGARVEPGLVILDSKTGVRRSKIDFPACDFGDNEIRAPIADGRGSIYFACRDSLYKINVATKSLIWQQSISSYDPEAPPGGQSGISQLAIDDNRIYVVINTGYVEARNPNTGEIDWQWKTPFGSVEGDFLANVVSVGDFLVISQADSYGGFQLTSATYVIDKATRSLAWSMDIGGRLSIANGTLLISHFSTEDKDEGIIAVGFDVITDSL